MIALPNEKGAQLRAKVAREAATLLYFGLEKEYKQAKVKAAQTVGTRILPSNLEVALELDSIAEQTEGSGRVRRLVEMRTDALQIMTALKVFYPILIGSVWRGTIRKTSDIDIEVYSDMPTEVLTKLNDAQFKIARTQHMTVYEQGKTQTSLHIYGESARKYPVEVVVRNCEERGKKRMCDTFGDEIKGLTVEELEKLLATDASCQFLPT